MYEHLNPLTHSLKILNEQIDDKVLKDLNEEVNKETMKFIEQFQHKLFQQENRHF